MYVNVQKYYGKKYYGNPLQLDKICEELNPAKMFSLYGIWTFRTLHGCDGFLILQKDVHVGLFSMSLHIKHSQWEFLIIQWVPRPR